MLTKPYIIMLASYAILKVTAKVWRYAGIKTDCSLFFYIEFVIIIQYNLTFAAK